MLTLLSSESFNACLFNRRLLVKGENTLVHASSLQVNSAVALASIYYNRKGDAKKYIMASVAKWTVNDMYLERQASKAKQKAKVLPAKIERKAAKRASDQAKQLQNQTTSVKRKKMEEEALAYVSCKTINKSD